MCKGASLVGSAVLLGLSGNPSYPHFTPRLYLPLQTALEVLCSGLIAVAGM